MELKGGEEYTSQDLRHKGQSTRNCGQVWGRASLLTTGALLHSHCHSQSTLYSRAQRLQMAEHSLEAAKGRQPLQSQLCVQGWSVQCWFALPVLHYLFYSSTATICLGFFKPSSQQEQAYRWVVCVYSLLSVLFFISTINNYQYIDQFPLNSGKQRS